MSDKTYLRDSCGPRAVDSGHRSDRSHSDRTRQRDGDDKSRSKHGSSRRSSKSESSHGRKSSSSGSCSTSAVPERPRFELDVLAQPQRSIAYGMTVETSVIASLKVPSPDVVAQYRSIDISRLMAVISLVVDTRSGERMPIECGTLTGQKMFDTLHPVPQEVAASLAHSQPCRLTLGYFTFPALLIRQPGTYRLRVTLIKMSGSDASSGGSSLTTVDSDSIKVERRSTGSANPRKHQRG